MGDFKQAASLLRLAKADYDALCAMGANPPFHDLVFGFHAQQTVEKSLKGWLCCLGLPCPRTHELAELLALLESGGVAVDAYLSLAQFTIFSVQARYEEGIVTPADPLDRPAVVAEVGALLRHVAGIVGIPDLSP